MEPGYSLWRSAAVFLPRPDLPGRNRKTEAIRARTATATGIATMIVTGTVTMTATAIMTATPRPAPDMKTASATAARTACHGTVLVLTSTVISKPHPADTTPTGAAAGNIGPSIAKLTNRATRPDISRASTAAAATTLTIRTADKLANAGASGFFR